MQKPKLVIVAGPGRAGTSCLMLILTKLGLDTELDEQSFKTEWRAGCEITAGRNFFSNDLSIVQQIGRLPRIVKSPQWCFALKTVMELELADVEHVFIPVRDAEKAAASRLQAGLPWNAGKQHLQVKVNQQALGALLETCILHDIPYTTLKFPEYLQPANWGATYYKLCRGLPELSGENMPGQFKQVFMEITKQCEALSLQAEKGHDSVV
jgi:hypothetical protein